MLYHPLVPFTIRNSYLAYTSTPLDISQRAAQGRIHNQSITIVPWHQLMAWAHILQHQFHDDLNLIC